MHTYIHREGHTLPVPISTVMTPIRSRASRRYSVVDRPWPVILWSDWVRLCMEKYGGVFMLGGKTLDHLGEIENMLAEFWRRYKYVDDAYVPSTPERTIPCYVHGDEGRGQKQRPTMVLSFQPVLSLAGPNKVNSTGYLGTISTPILAYMCGKGVKLWCKFVGVYL